MREFFTLFKNALFGIVVMVWGIAIMLSTHLHSELTLQLLFINFTAPQLGAFFLVAGIMHIVSKIFPDKYFAALANIMLAFVFLLAMLTHLFVSVYLIAWIAFAGITLNLVINAFLILKGD